MSDYDTLENRPSIEEERPKPAGKLKPLPAAVNIPLGLQQSEEGIANEDHLRELYNIGRRDSSKVGWSAADYNNLACAIFWLYKEERKDEAISYFAKALALESSNLSSEARETIENNLKQIECPSREDGKE